MMKRTLAVFLVIVLVACLLSACGSEATPAPTTTSDETTTSSKEPPAVEETGRKAANEITVGILQDLDDSLDPYQMTAAGTREVMFNVYEGLVKPDSTGSYVNAVASQVDVSEDGLTYTFTLRDSVMFHNGKTVTTDDVLYSFETCAATTVTSAVATALSAVTELRADGNQIIAVLSEPNSDFLAYVSSVYIVPNDYIAQATQPVGTGPFRYVSRSVQENVILEKNADYYGAPAYVDRVVFKIYEDQNAMVLALDSGALDLASHLTIDQLATLTNGYDVLEDNMNLAVAMYLNNAVAPFDSMLVRQALCYAIDVDLVMEFAEGGHGTKIGSSMYPNFSKYFDASLADNYAYDPAKAAELLAEAGYADGFSFSITVPSNYEHPYGDMAQVIIEQLSQVGITAEINWVDWSTWVSDTYSGRNFEATIVGFDASVLSATAMLQRWTTGAKKNMIGYSNADYDAAYAAALSCTDDAEQTALFKQCLQILSETAANVYIQDLPEYVAMNPALTGYVFYPLYVMDMSMIRYAD